MTTKQVIKLGQPAARTGSPAEWPTPPHELMEYGENPETHLLVGKREFETMQAACASHEITLASMDRMLDFGCSNGRITRWFDTKHSEVWGSDIQADKVLWAQENLGPPIRFIVNTMEPHLPFADGYLNFICAHSVFTHIMELHATWLMELCRILSPNGVLLITLQDEIALDPKRTPRAQILLDKHFKGHQEIEPDLRKIGFLAMNTYTKVSTLAQVYISKEYLLRILPPWMTLVGVVERAYSDLQTAYVLRKSR